MLFYVHTIWRVCPFVPGAGFRRRPGNYRRPRGPTHQRHPPAEDRRGRPPRETAATMYAKSKPMTQSWNRWMIACSCPTISEKSVRLVKAPREARRKCPSATLVVAASAPPAPPRYVGSRQDRSQDRTGNANPSQSQKTPMVHGVRESILRPSVDHRCTSEAARLVAP
jgi:hypothetical protein